MMVLMMKEGGNVEIEGHAIPGFLIDHEEAGTSFANGSCKICQLLWIVADGAVFVSHSSENPPPFIRLQMFQKAFSRKLKLFKFPYFVW